MKHTTLPAQVEAVTLTYQQYAESLNSQVVNWELSQQPYLGKREGAVIYYENKTKE